MLEKQEKALLGTDLQLTTYQSMAVHYKTENLRNNNILNYLFI